MKKMYIQPIVEKAEMQPQSIICASVTQGQNTSQGPGGDTMYTD